ncbi:MAG: putative rane protein [Rubrobacteraceae bacterium]|jgi:uncharacterized membrane protein|nr:putative rane protein [Rubrobacteraceae bacterium]
MTNLMMILYEGGHEGGPFHIMGDIFGALIGLLVLVGFLALIAWGAMRVLSAGRSGERVDSAEEILRERFARGEIAAEEYEKSLETLSKNPLPETPPRRSYEDYVREVMERLRPRRGTGS